MKCLCWKLQAELCSHHQFPADKAHQGCEQGIKSSWTCSAGLVHLVPAAALARASSRVGEKAPAASWGPWSKACRRGRTRGDKKAAVAISDSRRGTLAWKGQTQTEHKVVAATTVSVIPKALGTGSLFVYPVSCYHWQSQTKGSNSGEFGQKFPSLDTAHGSIMSLYNEAFHWCQDSSKSRYSENGILSCIFQQTASWGRLTHN